jgi:hypothetical protein
LGSGGKIKERSMKPSEIDTLIEPHIAAERAGDTAGAVAVYTEDVEHDVVGSPGGPSAGRPGGHATEAERSARTPRSGASMASFGRE